MQDDTGSQLRALYEPVGGVRAIFSSKVADYRASRPDYPAQLFDALRTHCNLANGALIADVGAGTGLLTQGFLQRGYRVVAVEPNPEMRKACDHLLAGNAAYRSVEGSAESMPLESGSVNLITAAQAFHWFEVEPARKECVRVLRNEGQVALIWNDRLVDDPLHAALDELFGEFGGAKRTALIAHEDRGNVSLFFGAGARTELTWPHEHRLDAAGLFSLVLSRSYMPARDSVPGKEVAARVEKLHRSMAVDGYVQVRYTTIVILGRPQEPA